jgi:hypothetical protein
MGKPAALAAPAGYAPSRSRAVFPWCRGCHGCHEANEMNHPGKKAGAACRAAFTWRCYAARSGVAPAGADRARAGVAVEGVRGQPGERYHCLRRERRVLGPRPPTPRPGPALWGKIPILPRPRAKSRPVSRGRRRSARPACSGRVSWVTHRTNSGGRCQAAIPWLSLSSGGW